jgi:hypothetical protein
MLVLPPTVSVGLWRRWTLSLSIAFPAKPRNAGSKVTAATTATRTTIAAAVAIMPTKAIPEIHRPRRAMATMMPEITTAWPAVALASPTACNGTMPSCRFCR